MENRGKKQEVQSMFNRIAHRYDFLNHFLSAGIDRRWRKKAIRILSKQRPKTILDVATGTADLAIVSAQLNPKNVTGVDIADDMLAIGRQKIDKMNLANIIRLENGDSENLRFQDGSFDAAMVAFGVRNFENLEKGLAEMRRVLQPGGMILVLEFSRPRKFPVKQLYGFYFRFILPSLGRIISGDAAAYTYLPDSVGVFPDGENFTAILEKVGFKNAQYKPLTFGIATIYTAIK
jgi:demethylmenaquinone methyltransferase/2-methoxy-6-polyprenyl-1,4-benzoquinol methylase